MVRKAINLLLAFVMTAGVAILPAHSAKAASAIQRLPSGAQLSDGAVDAQMNSDGRYVVFDTYIPLVASDTNRREDVYLQDRLANSIQRMSVDSSGAQFSSDSFDGSISADGRYVTFNQYFGNSKSAIYLRDRQTTTTTLVTSDETGAMIGGTNYGTSISNDGRYVAFGSSDHNLLPNEYQNYNVLYQVYVKDMQTGALTWVSTDSSGNPGFSGTPETTHFAASQAIISGDGRSVVFNSQQSLAHDQTPYTQRFYVYKKNLDTGITTLVSKDTAGNGVGGFGPNVSTNGQLVTFYAYSESAGITADDTNNYSDVFLYDSTTDSSVLVSKTADGQLANGNSSDPYGSARVTDDGHYVIFASAATNFVGNEIPHCTSSQYCKNIYRKDMQSGTITLISLGTDAQGGNKDSYIPSMSSDGSLVLFTSDANNLISGDTNNAPDIFLSSPVVDTAAPLIANATFSTNPKSVTQSNVTLSAQITDEGSGVATAEYYNPATQAWVPMTLNGSTATATISTSAASFTAGMYTFQIRATDNLGNVSTPVDVNLDIFDPAAGYAAGHGFVTPNGATSNVGDILPDQSGNNVKASFDFSVKYETSTSTVPAGSSVFTWGTNCNKPSNNCFQMTTDSLHWLIVNNSTHTAVFQGLATLTQGAESLGSNYPVRITTFAGGTTGTPSHYLLRIYSVGANPDVAAPLYQASGDLTGGQVVLH